MPLIIPTPERENKLKQIHDLLDVHRKDDDMDALLEAVSLMIEDKDFAEEIAQNDEFKGGLKTGDQMKRVPWAYLFHFLYQRDYVSAAIILWGPEIFNTKPHCVQLIWKYLFESRMICIIGGGGQSKCLGPEVGVTMFDGSEKKAKDIKPLDLLMGDDGTSRKVISTNAGHGPMYRIVPYRGEPWTCNGDHILTLRCNTNKYCSYGGVSKKRFKGMTIDVPLNEYLSWSKSKKEFFMLFHVGAEYPDRTLPFDPYIYGAWIGDGNFNEPILHTPDGPMAQEWVRYFDNLGGYMVTYRTTDSCPYWRARTIKGSGNANPFISFIRTSRENGEKIILDDYLFNSRKNRLRLLAGLIDSDGYVLNGTAYAFVSKFERLARQVVRLARSLGFSATIYPHVHSIASIGFSAIYWRVNISGSSLRDIPTLEKHAAPNTTKSDLSHTRFDVESIGDGDFYGFEIDKNRRFLLGDYTVTHNTMGPSAFFLLEWLLDPEWTRLQVASASEDHLKKNLYADIVRLHDDSAIPLPGANESESISINKRRGMGIFTLVLPGGPNSRGKLKGAHTKPRPKHALFGDRSRVFTILDEGQEVPQNIFAEIPNRFSGAEPNDVDHIKFVLSANPKEKFSEFGKLCCPIGGWDNWDPEAETWISEQGWRIIRLNAEKHENVVAKRKIFNGFVTYEGVKNWLQRCEYDTEHPDYWTYVKGMFPPAGTQATIIRAENLTKSQGEWIFDGATTMIAAHDPAFTGDRPMFGCGRVGKAVAWKTLSGQRRELPSPRMAVQIDDVSILPRGDTQDLATENMTRCKDLGVKPQNYGIDKTGNGIGVHDVIRRQWYQKVMGTTEETAAPIQGIGYGESPTEVKICEEDTETPKQMFDKMCAELWYAASKLIEFDCVRFGRTIDQETYAELSSRQGGSRPGLGRKRGVEPKDAYKRRTGRPSPDKADTVTMILHVARISISGLIPRAPATPENPQQERIRPIPDEVTLEVSYGMTGMDGVDGFGEMKSLDMTRD